MKQRKKKLEIVWGDVNVVIAQAQQDVFDTLALALLGSVDDPHVIQAALPRSPAADPLAQASATGEALGDLVARLQAQLAEAQQRAERLQADNEDLRRLNRQYTDHPLQDRVAALAQERDQWCDVFVFTHRRAQALEQSQRAYLAQIDQLEEQVAHLNRIVVDQQNQIDQIDDPSAVHNSRA